MQKQISHNNFKEGIIRNENRHVTLLVTIQIQTLDKKRNFRVGYGYPLGVTGEALNGKGITIVHPVPTHKLKKCC